MNERESEKPGQNFLEKVIDDTIRRFWLKSSYLYHGSKGDIEQPYHIDVAATDALRETGLDFVTALSLLTSQTKLKPKDLSLDIAISGESWDGVFENLCTSLIDAEVCSRDVKSKEENERRGKLFDWGV